MKTQPGKGKAGGGGLDKNETNGVDFEVPEPETCTGLDANHLLICSAGLEVHLCEESIPHSCVN